MRFKTLTALSLLFSFSKSIAGEPTNNALDSLKSQIDSVDSQLTLLSQRKELYDNFFNSLEGLHGMYEYHLTWFSVILTVLAGFSIVFQFVATKRENDALRDLKKTFMDSSRSQQANNDTLIDKVGKNIEATTGFIEAYQSMIDMRTESENLKNAVNRLQEEEKTRKKNVVEEQKSINAKAIRLMDLVLISKYSSGYFNSRDIKSFEEFYIQVNAHLPDLSKYPDIERLCNGNVYFIMGLSNFLSNQARDANKYLLQAKNRIAYLTTAVVSTEDDEILYSEMTIDLRNERKNKWDKMSLGWTYFYLGLNHYKLGEFVNSSSNFEEAIKNLQNDIDSVFYLYQSKYWGNNFNSLVYLIKEFEDRVTETLNKNAEIFTPTRKLIEARLQTKIGDFCSHSEEEDRFDIDKAMSTDYYKRGFQMIQEAKATPKIPIKTFGQIVPMNYYGLANSLQGKSVVINDREYSSKELYFEAEKAAIAMVKSIDNQETQYILQYIAADCLFNRSEFRDALLSIDSAIERFKIYYPGKNNMAYSPIKNVMLSKINLEEELFEFRKQILDNIDPSTGKKPI